MAWGAWARNLPPPPSWGVIWRPQGAGPTPPPSTHPLKALKMSQKFIKNYSGPEFSRTD